ncbi:unnamed protein product [Discula destructiva]
MYFPTILLLSALSGSLVAAGPVHLQEQPVEAREVEARAAKTISYDCSDTPGICLNACWAQHCRGISGTLHGGGGADDAAKRTAWGYGFKTPGWKAYVNGVNTSPEEYPYASSKEGGLNGAGKTVALRCVPSKEQQKQGGKVKGLKTSANTDTWVTDIKSFTNLAHLKTLINPKTGAGYDWCDATTKCVNDGHQFTATSKGVFALG